MRSNKLTPGKNVMWESSRMMLPEHVEVLQKHHRELKKKVKPSLDPQKLEEISAIVSDSYTYRLVVQLTVFDEYEDRYVTGVVTYLDAQLKRLKIVHGDDEMWIRYSVIIDACYTRHAT